MATGAAIVAVENAAATSSQGVRNLISFLVLLLRMCARRGHVKTNSQSKHHAVFAKQ
jgi:hypothetical protein